MPRIVKSSKRKATSEGSITEHYAALLKGPILRNRRLLLTRLSTRHAYITDPDSDIQSAR
jgi:hypothetical protein